MRSRFRNDRGSALVDGLIVVGLAVALVASFHIGVVKRWKKNLDMLQRSRLSYDGWRPRSGD